MANSKISALTSATTPLAGTEVLPVVQSGATTKVSVANLTAGRDVSASGLSVDANSATDAVRITQTGAGNALLVEDSTNPDSTPFVINSIGNVGIGGLPNNATTSLTAWTDTGAWANITIGKSNNGDNSPNFNFSKSRGTRSVPVIVNNSDNSGSISFNGYDGSAYVSMATIRSFVDGTPGVSDMPGRLVLSTTADGAASPTERMRIDSSGNVGIGTSSPASRLEVRAANTVTDARGVVAINSTNAAAANLGGSLSLGGENGQATTPYVFGSVAGRYEGSGYSGYLQFSTTASSSAITERMRIDSAGNVGIGAVPTSAAKANITSTSAGASTIALSLQNASNTINSETVLDFVTNTSGAGVRSAQITAINTTGSTGVNMLFKIGNGAVATEAMRITSLGGLQIQTGVGVGAATPGTSGVAFPATAIAVADANTLDDYEEGTWTPVVTFTGGNGDLTTSEALGVYTKIGRLVQIAFNVEFSETTAATNLTITGVPFTSGGSVRTTAGCFVDNMTTLVGAPVIQLNTSSTTIVLFTTGTGGAAQITNLNTGALARVRGSLSYSI